MGQFQFIDFSSSLWVMYSCPLCLVILGWMLDTVNFTLLDSEYVCVSIIVLEHCLAMLLSYL